MTLREALTPIDLALCRVHFRWDIGDIEVSWVVGDGAGGNRASTRGNVASSSRRIILDSTDVPQVDGRALLADVRARETVLHELIHCDQARRGLGYRLKMWWWNKTRPYAERPHEIRAREQAYAWAVADHHAAKDDHDGN